MNGEQESQTCPGCGKGFQPTREDQKYCTAKCGQKARFQVWMQKQLDAVAKRPVYVVIMRRSPRSIYRSDEATMFAKQESALKFAAARKRKTGWPYVLEKRTVRQK